VVSDIIGILPTTFCYNLRVSIISVQDTVAKYFPPLHSSKKIKYRYFFRIAVHGDRPKIRQARITEVTSAVVSPSKVSVSSASSSAPLASDNSGTTFVPSVSDSTSTPVDEVVRSKIIFQSVHYGFSFDSLNISMTVFLQTGKLILFL
jgi:hypothetical protein